MADLLPCPFCGGRADFEQITDSGTFATWSVGCQSSESDCIGYQMLAHYNRKCEAAEAWNKRAPHPLHHAQGVPEPRGWERRNIGPDGSPFSDWYWTDDKPTPENMKFDGYLSYEYRPLYAGCAVTSTQSATPHIAEMTRIIAQNNDCDKECAKYPEGCGCAKAAAEALAISSTERST